MYGRPREETRRGRSEDGRRGLRKYAMASGILHQSRVDLAVDSSFSICDAMRCYATKKA